MELKIFDRQKDLSIGKGSVRSLVRAVLGPLSIAFKELAIYFVTKKKIGQIHGEFFKDPTPTDCISFPGDLGEIFVCPAVAIQYANKRELDPYEETSLYVVHGLLHLLGHDDQDPKARRVMRKKEKSCMEYLYKQKALLAPK